MWTGSTSPGRHGAARESATSPSHTGASGCSADSACWRAVGGAGRDLLEVLGDSCSIVDFHGLVGCSLTPSVCAGPTIVRLQTKPPSIATTFESLCLHPVLEPT